MSILVIDMEVIRLKIDAFLMHRQMIFLNISLKLFKESVKEYFYMLSFCINCVLKYPFVWALIW